MTTPDRLTVAEAEELFHRHVSLPRTDMRGIMLQITKQLLDTMRENENMRQTLEMLSKKQIATWYNANVCGMPGGYYAGWDDAEYAVRVVLAGEPYPYKES